MKKKLWAILVVLLIGTFLIVGCGGGSGGSGGTNPTPPTPSTISGIFPEIAYQISEKNKQYQNLGIINGAINAPTGITTYDVDFNKIGISGFGNGVDGSTYTIFVKNNDTGEYNIYREINSKNYFSIIYNFSDCALFEGNQIILLAHQEEKPNSSFIFSYNENDDTLTLLAEISNMNQAHVLFFNEDKTKLWLASHLNKTIGYIDVLQLSGVIEIPEQQLYDLPYKETDNPLQPFSGRMYDGNIYLTDFYANRVVQFPIENIGIYDQLKESEFSITLKDQFGIEDFIPNGIEITNGNVMCVGWGSSTRQTISPGNFAIFGSISAPEPSPTP